jgi:hypothetical protein
MDGRHAAEERNAMAQGIDPKLMAQIDALAKSHRSGQPIGDLSPELIAYLRTAQAQQMSNGGGLARGFATPDGMTLGQQANYATANANGSPDSQAVTTDPSQVDWSQSPIDFLLNTDESNRAAVFSPDGKFLHYEERQDDKDWRDAIISAVMVAPAVAGVYGGAGAATEGGAVTGAGGSSAAGGGAGGSGGGLGAAAGNAASSITLPTTAEVAAGSAATVGQASGALANTLAASGVSGAATGLSAATGGTTGGYTTAAADSQLANAQLGLSANSGSVPASVNLANAGGTMSTSAGGTGILDTLQQAANSPLGKAATSAAITGLSAAAADGAAPKPDTASLDQLLGQFLSEMQKTSARGDDQWNDYLKTWRPIEQQYAQRALNWDTPERRNQVASEAAGSVASQFDVARTQGHRDALAAGLDPSTIANMNTASLIEEAKAKAGASNQARSQVEEQGMSYLGGAANFGRNLPSTSLQASGVATGQGNSAANATNSANNTNMQATRDRNALYGDILGAGLKAWGMYSSSEKTKHMGDEVDGLAAARAVQDSPAHAWRYREGQGDGDTKPRMGPTAESLSAVAPEVSDGKQVDGIAMLGLHHAAIGGQNERLARIEEALGLASAGG